LDDNLLGASEVANLLGVSRQRVYQLKTTYPTFPKPIVQLARGALWSGIEVDRWARQWRRNTTPKGGRPKGARLD
jgi:predicted DNA-binding transcriptional regulator AlpA